MTKQDIYSYISMDLIIVKLKIVKRENINNSVIYSLKIVDLKIYQATKAFSLSLVILKNIAK